MNSPEFPLFRKYPDGRSFFRIDSATSFTELKLNPPFYSYMTIEATIHPDRVLIADMIEKRDGFWVDATQSEFDEQYAHAQENLTLF